MFLFACQRIAGENFALLAQLANAVANGVTMYLLCKVVWELSKSDVAVLLAFGLSVAFVPLTLFSTFIYGNLVCLPWTMGAWLLCLRACNKERDGRRRVVYLVVAGVLLAIGTLFKSTVKIASIAFAITVAVYAVRNKAWKLLPAAIVPFVLTTLVMGGILGLLEHKMRTNLHGPVPQLSWVAMGIGAGQEYYAEREGTPISPGELEWPGYFDGYVSLIPGREGFETWGDLNRHAIGLRLERFLRDPGYALAFFGQKLAIEWLEPTNEGFLVSNYEGRKEGDFLSRLADDHREYTFFGHSFYYGPANAVLYMVCDVAQSLISIGALLWCVCRFRKRDNADEMQLFALVYVLGAAFLYVFWENKSQYLLPYWLFLIPYAACGWKEVGVRLAAFLEGLWDRRKLAQTCCSEEDVESSSTGAPLSAADAHELVR